MTNLDRMAMRTEQHGKFTIVHGPSGASISKDGKVIATAKRGQGRQWILRVPGHQWEITPDMPISRFQKIPGGKALTQSPVKGFKSLAACVKEVDRLTTRNAHVAEPLRSIVNAFAPSAGIKFGSRVFDKADPTHTAIVRNIVHRNDGSLAAIEFEETGFKARVPLADLRLAPEEPVVRTECDLMLEAIEAGHCAPPISH